MVVTVRHIKMHVRWVHTLVREVISQLLQLTKNVKNKNTWWQKYARNMPNHPPGHISGTVVVHV